jgi:hypothetical protein
MKRSTIWNRRAIAICLDRTRMRPKRWTARVRRDVLLELATVHAEEAKAVASCTRGPGRLT